MPTSKTEICNMALAHCGIDARIEDVDTETSNPARNCRLFYDHNVKTLLETQRWPFAAERVTLVSIGSPPTNWAYRYVYPNFALRINHIVNPTTKTPDIDEKIPFQIMNRPTTEDAGRAIITDQEDAEADINRSITNPNLFSTTFVQALSFFLASHIATPLRVDTSITTSITDQFRFWMAEAGNQTFSEAQESVEPESEFFEVRA